MLSLVVLLAVGSAVAGCRPTGSSQLYVDSGARISLEKPGHWDVAYFERSAVTVLESGPALRADGSARIEIRTSACTPSPSWFEGGAAELNFNIERIRSLYALEFVSIIQAPTKVELGRYEALEAVISIPTMSLPADAVENQLGARKPGLEQTIHMFGITDGNKFRMVYFYPGLSERTNAEARAIIASIQSTCTD